MTGRTQPKLAGAADWVLCPGCRTLLYGKRLARAQHVCPECSHHHRLTAAQRIDQLLDAEGRHLFEYAAGDADVLGFTDTAPYPQRLAGARASTGMTEAVLLAAGTVLGEPVVTAVMDFRFLGGSLGAVVGELITRAAEIAVERRVPLLLVSASGGARMQEGAVSLMQMAKTSQALARLDEAGILTLSLVTDPTYGGVAASFASLADVIIAEPGARMGFAGPRVIAQTIRETLPDGFQTAEFLRERGHIDVICPRAELRPALARLLRVGGGRNAAPAPSGPAAPAGEGAPDSEVIRDHSRLSAGDAWQAVQTARSLDRPTTLDYLAGAFEDFQELHGDRVGGGCRAIVGGPARLDGMPVMVVGHQKGRTAAELTTRNYGMPTPAGYRKAARLMRMAAKLRLPLVTIVDTPGAYPGVSAEEQGQAGAIAENIRLMSTLPVPVVTLVSGEGGSGGALALAVANEVLICSSATYSVISPEGCAAILWNDPGMARTAAAALRIDAGHLLRLGVVDGVVPEPPGGSQADPHLAVQRVGAALADAVRRLSALDANALVAGRRDRFRAFGAHVVVES
ncbi:acetyl-CoA carboxylase, carboxyltransferase subunit beta [Krasilnikovia cinnamomea]|nr:acetyl-CoA carboxylase, carboxyltransferase subunit beta [Krasilnikovia cinnamomea]